MGKLKSLSIKKTFCLIVILTAIVVILLSAASVRICSNIRDQILLPHAFILQPSIVQPEGNPDRWKIHLGSERWPDER